jgi:hypothetical protein
MEREVFDICCNVNCPERFSCQLFARAMDVNSGKMMLYQIIECKNFNYYKK